MERTVAKELETDLDNDMSYRGESFQIACFTAAVGRAIRLPAATKQPAKLAAWHDEACVRGTNTIPLAGFRIPFLE